jgi:hypothetical protein
VQNRKAVNCYAHGFTYVYDVAKQKAKSNNLQLKLQCLEVHNEEIAKFYTGRGGILTAILKVYYRNNYIWAYILNLL